MFNYLNISLNKDKFIDVIFIIIFKIFFAFLIVFVFKKYIGEDLHISNDFNRIYSVCNQQIANQLFTMLICQLNIESLDENSAILISIFINLGIIICFYNLFYTFIEKKYRYFLILLIIIHPYTSVHLIKFSTDVFITLAVLLITYYIIKKRSPDIFFVLSSFILMNFKNSLTVMFLLISLFFLLNSIFRKSLKDFTYTCIIIFFSVLVFTINYEYISIAPQIFLKFNIALNTYNLLSFREITSLLLINHLREEGLYSLINLIFENNYLIIQFLFSILFFIFHFIGLFYFNLKFKNMYGFFILFAFLLPYCLTLGHLRYLLPFITLISIGFTIFIQDLSKTLKK